MRRFVILTLLISLLFLSLPAALAQETEPVAEPGEAVVVTDNDVNEIAKKLYCPVCENIPLDACGTAACSDWRYEIQLQLEAGMTEDQIINDFVYRFGDRVVGTPQSTLPRLVSLVTPWLAIAAGLFFGWRYLQSRSGEDSENTASTYNPGESAYRDLLEQDVTG